MLAVFLWCTPQISGAKSNATKTENILILGDSLSAEYGLAKNSGWINLLSEKLNANRNSVKIINASISGETTAGGLERLNQLLKQNKPNILIIELGGNDALRGLALDATKSNIENMIKLAKASHCEVLLLGMQIPSNYGKKYSQDFKKLYGEIAKSRKTNFVPFFLEGVALDPGLFQADRIHPNEKAQKIMMENVWTELEKML